MTDAPAVPLLAIRGLVAAYGNIEALKGVDLEILPGEIVALIGANGAGKSTLMMTLCGTPRCRAGSIRFGDADITQTPTHEIIRLGIAQSPEGRRIFPRMTVAENLRMGADAAVEGSEAERAASLERVFALFPRLKERMSQRGGTLSGGEQQMLAVARALMLRPRLMLLDEPSFGLAPLVVRDLFGILGKINREDKVTILVVEQNAQLALELAEQAFVIETGRIVMPGSAKEIADNEDIRKSYLGY